MAEGSSGVDAAVAASSKPLTRAERRSILGWVMYDFAESAFATSLLVAVLPIYYLGIAPKGSIVLSLGPWHIATAATSLWAYTVSLSTLLVAIPSPVLGSIADSSGARKRSLALFGYVGALFSGLLVLVGQGEYLLASALFCIANVGSVGGSIFYNSLLVDVAPPGRMDWLSGKGFAYGYVGGGTLLVANLIMIARPGWFGIPSVEWAARISFLTVGIWWAVFALPTLLWVRELPFTDLRPTGRYLSLGIRRTWGTIRHLVGYRDLFCFLLAYLIFNDGIQTVIVIAIPYGKETLGIGTGTLMGVLVLIQAIGVPGSLLWGKIAEKWGAKRAQTATLVIWSGVVIYAWRMTSAIEFWVLGLLVGIVLGGSQAISRSLYGAMIPPARTAEFYGFFAMSSRFSSFLGPLAFGLTHDLTGSMRAGILFLIVFFLAGLALLAFVDVERGRRLAHEG